MNIPAAIEQLPVASLNPYPRNARTHTEEQVARVAESIREFGFTNPVLVDATGTIVAGHCRVRAAAKIGIETVPCVRLAHLTPEQVRAYVIADNRLALDAGWDESLLAEELRAIDADGLLTITGFSDDELKRLLEVPASPTDFPAVDANLPVDHRCPKCGYQWSGKPS